MTIEKIMEVMNNNLQKSMNTTDQMINILKGEMSIVGPRAEWDDLVKCKCGIP